MRQPQEITTLKDTIRETHGCDALYKKTVHTGASFAPDPKWNGLVMVFELIGHPEAECCYAWSYRADRKLKAVAVLQMPPVSSPETAVHFAAASG